MVLRRPEWGRRRVGARRHLIVARDEAERLNRRLFDRRPGLGPHKAGDDATRAVSHDARERGRAALAGLGVLGDLAAGRESRIAEAGEQAVPVALQSARESADPVRRRPLVVPRRDGERLEQIDGSVGERREREARRVVLEPVRLPVAVAWPVGDRRVHLAPLLG